MARIAELVDTAMEATVVPSFSRIGIAVRSRLQPGWNALDDHDLSGRTIVITGANSGLGLAAATQLAGLGARLHLLVRSDEKGRDTAREIERQTGNTEVGFGVADLTDLDSVRRFAGTVPESTDTIVHNAGAMFDERRLTVDGHERTFQVHVLAPFLLTSLLLPRLRDNAPGRVVFVSSGGMYTQPLITDRLESSDDYRPATAYARAKRAQVELTDELARRLPDSGVVFHAMHPGWAATPGVERSLPRFNTVMGPLLRSADQGADTIVWLAAARQPLERSGLFWHDRQPRSRHKFATTRTRPGEAERLWEHLVLAAGSDPVARLRGDAVR